MVIRRNAGRRRDSHYGWIIALAVYGLLVTCLAALIARWAGLLTSGPNLSSGNILVAIFAVALIGFALLAALTWAHLRRIGIPGMWPILIFLLLLVGGMLWFVMSYAASWGP